MERGFDGLRHRVDPSAQVAAARRHATEDARPESDTRHVVQAAPGHVHPHRGVSALGDLGVLGAHARSGSSAGAPAQGSTPARASTSRRRGVEQQPRRAQRLGHVRRSRCRVLRAAGDRSPPRGLRVSGARLPRMEGHCAHLAFDRVYGRRLSHAAGQDVSSTRRVSPSERAAVSGQPNDRCVRSVRPSPPGIAAGGARRRVARMPRSRGRYSHLCACGRPAGRLARLEGAPAAFAQKHDNLLGREPQSVHGLCLVAERSFLSSL